MDPTPETDTTAGSETTAASSADAPGEAPTAGARAKGHASWGIPGTRPRPASGPHGRPEGTPAGPSRRVDATVAATPDATVAATATADATVATTAPADATVPATTDATAPADETGAGSSRDGMPVQPKLPAAAGGGRGFPSAIRSSGRVRGVDGLRTLAVVLVMIYHLEPGLLPGGSIGVDIFFTISGFVITRLLIAEYARTGDVSMGAFYWRRWLRLVPALLTVCVVFAVLAGVTTLPGIDGAWTSVLLSVTFLVNIVRAAQPGAYSDGTSLLAQNWSLGVEEQFYLLWPPLLRALLHRVRPRTVLIWASVLCFLPVVWRWLLWDPTQAHRIYNGTDTRADQLLAGALLAIAVARLRLDDRRLAALRRWSGRLAWPSMAVLGLIVWQIPVTGDTAWTESWYTVGFLATALLSATVIAALELRPHSALSSLLSLAPVAWVGRNLSYGLYLWHYPLGRLLADLGVDRGHLVATLAASFAAATASYYLVEQPLNRRWRRRGPGAGRPGGTGGGGRSRIAAARAGDSSADRGLATVS